MKVLFMCLGLLACGCRFADKAFADEQADFWVAPDGKDTDPGTKERPFATLARARDAVRALRQAELGRDILVLFRSGTYVMCSIVSIRKRISRGRSRLGEETMSQLVPRNASRTPIEPLAAVFFTW